MKRRKIMGWCTDLMNAILDYIFKSGTYTGTFYLGLATSIAANGAITGEPSGNGYARVEVTNDTDNWNDAANGAVDNKADFTFPEATGSWGTMTKWFLSTSSSGGTAVTWGPLTVQKTITEGNTPKFSAGDLDVCNMTDSDA
jgi:hypothetical protein